MACPGSVALSESLPTTTKSESYAAQEGTCAHELAHVSLISQRQAASFIGQSFAGIEVTPEMAEHVQVYLDHVRTSQAVPGSQHWYEQKFSLAALNPPVPMFGTTDHAAYIPETRTLYVDDLKYGAGVMVEIEGNPQTKYYALGAVLSLDLKAHPVETVVMTIVQPRKEHEDGFVRSDTITIDQLWAFGRELIEAAEKTLDPNAPLVPGDHCRWCRARPVCPALYAKSQEIAAVEFEELSPVVLPPAPATLTPEQLGMVLSKLPLLDDWSKSVKEHAEQLLRDGHEVPGFKLVERRPRRVWKDAGIAEEVLAGLVENLGVSATELYEPATLRPVPQVEKLFHGKKKFAAIMGAHVEKKSSGVKLAPVTDKSPAVQVTVGAEFEMLPEASSGKTTGADNEEEAK